MKYGFPTLTGVITDPAKALDKILQAYFYSDTAKHGIDVPTYSLRSDMVDGDNISGNIEKSLKSILSNYFDTFTVSAIDRDKNGNVQSIQLEVSVTDGAQIIATEQLLNLDGGELKSIAEVGHL